MGGKKVRYILEENPEADKSMMIPKLIHQIWFQGQKKLPEKYVPYQLSWINHHPKYKYHFWDETRIKQLLSGQYPWYLPIWEKLPTMIQKIDAAKIFILHHYGGMITDMDMEALKSVEELLLAPLVLSCCYVHPFGVALAKMLGLKNFAKAQVNNGFIAASKHHPVIGRMTELLRTTSTLPPGDVYGVFIAKTCGTEVLVEAFNQITRDSVIEYVIYPPEYFEPKICLTKKPATTENTHVIHHSERTWVHDSPVAKNQMATMFIIIGIIMAVVAGSVTTAIVKMRLYSINKNKCVNSK